MSIKKIGLSALVMGSTLIAGCGSDSGDSSNTYLTYYNLSPNKASVLLYDDDTLISVVGYESTSSLKTLESGTNKIELKVEVSEDLNETLYEEDINLGKDKFNYLISFNDLGEDSADNLPVLFRFDNKSGDIDEETFEFNLMHLAPEISSLHGEITVEFVSTEDYAAAVNDGNDDDNDYTVLESFNVNFKESKTLTIDDDAEKYYVILKDSEGTQILRSASIAFGESQYFFALKDSKLNDTLIPSLARIYNSTGATLEFRDTSLESYFRIYNSADALGEVSLKLNGEALTDDEGNEYVQNVAPDTLSLFGTLEPENVGTYNVTLQHDDCSEAEDAPLADKCSSSPYSFRNGEDKTIVYYRGEPNDDRQTELENIAFSNTNRAITDNHQVTFVNLLNNQGDDAVDFYFVKKGEFIDNSAYSLIQRELGDINRFVIPSGTYDIYLTYDNENDVPVTLASEFNVEFGSDEGDQLGDWIIFAEPANDQADGSVDVSVSGRDAVLNRVPMNDTAAEASKSE
ncbi:hypothetical protein [Catenovulum adriaticum]|uniref:DUF4397 domain-containing protein n=1 Tax=Catenovulum adriaticum TaxID=2984846 RepID=A0ABY7APR5_9ALTE|nr:hypothetical protein [Catenovulum sp. TS8]WAJ70722.1 hypothetical protein OLW01_02595 [Catenovulum sp. TS8]